MAFCEHCGFRIRRGREKCERCGHLDFTYVDEDAKPVDPDRIRWADTEGYVIETTCRWASEEYIVVQDPDDVDSVLEHEPDRESAGLVGLLPLLRRHQEK